VPTSNGSPIPNATGRVSTERWYNDTTFSPAAAIHVARPRAVLKTSGKPEMGKEIKP